MPGKRRSKTTHGRSITHKFWRGTKKKKLGEAIAGLKEGDID
jgi:hypothetical protein